MDREVGRMRGGRDGGANDETSPAGSDDDGGDAPVPSSLDQRLRLRFHDHSRFWSAELTRVFASAIQAGSLGSKCDVAGPHDATPVEVDAEISNTGIIRGVD